MDYSKAYVNSHALANADTFICADKSCAHLNTTVTEDQRTYECERCGAYQYRGGNVMFLGKDAFTMEIEAQAADADALFDL